MKSFPIALVLVSLIAASQPSVRAEASLEQMRVRCEEARERRIAPMREEAIEDCVSAPRTTRTREDCERIYSDFGEVGGTVARGLRPALFNDLPECIEYLEARDRQEADRSRR